MSIFVVVQDMRDSGLKKIFGSGKDNRLFFLQILIQNVHDVRDIYTQGSKLDEASQDIVSSDCPLLLIHLESSRAFSRKRECSCGFP